MTRSEHREQVRKRRRKENIIVSLVVTFILITITIVSLPPARGDDFSAEQLQINQLVNDNAELTSQVESLTAEVTSLTVEYSALTTENASLSVKYEELQAEYEALKKAKAEAKITSTESLPEETSASASYWTKTQVQDTLEAAANEYGLNKPQTEWIVDIGTKVAYRESRYNTQASNNGKYLGLFQFNANWGSAAERLNPVWSCYRFVKVYVDGGQAAIYQHWKATTY